MTSKRSKTTVDEDGRSTSEKKKAVERWRCAELYCGCDLVCVATSSCSVVWRLTDDGVRGLKNLRTGQPVFGGFTGGIRIWIFCRAPGNVGGTKVRDALVMEKKPSPTLSEGVDCFVCWRAFEFMSGHSAPPSCAEKRHGCVKSA